MRIICVIMLLISTSIVCAGEPDFNVLNSSARRIQELETKIAYLERQLQKATNVAQVNDAEAKERELKKNLPLPKITEVTTDSQGNTLESKTIYPDGSEKYNIRAANGKPMYVKAADNRGDWEYNPRKDCYTRYERGVAVRREVDRFLPPITILPPNCMPGR